MREHVRGITSVKFSSTGEQVFSAGMDNVLNVWQVTDAFRDPEFDGVSIFSENCVDYYLVFALRCCCPLSPLIESGGDGALC